MVAEHHSSCSTLSQTLSVRLITNLLSSPFVFLSVSDSVPLDLRDCSHTQRDAVLEAPLLHKMRFGTALRPVAIVDVDGPNRVTGLMRESPAQNHRIDSTRKRDSHRRSFSNILLCELFQLTIDIVPRQLLKQFQTGSEFMLFEYIYGTRGERGLLIFHMVSGSRACLNGIAANNRCTKPIRQASLGVAFSKRLAVLRATRSSRPTASGSSRYRCLPS